MLSKKHIYIPTMIICIISILLVYNTSSIIDKIILYVGLISEFIMLYGITYNNKELIKFIHEIFFFVMIISVFILKDVKILVLLFSIYIYMILSRLYYGKCIIRIFDLSDPKDDNYIKTLTFNHKNFIMILLSFIIVYRINKLL